MDKDKYRSKMNKQSSRNCHLKQWLKEEPHKNHKKYSRKDRRKNKVHEPPEDL